MTASDLRPRKILLASEAGKETMFVHDCIHEHLPTGNLHTCISTLACVYREPFHNAYMCTCVQRAQPLSHSTHCCLSKKPSCAPQRQGNWVKSMSFSHHLMALPAPLLALLTPYPFPRAHTQRIPPLHTLSAFPEASTGGLLRGLLCAKVEAPCARPIRGETSALRNIKLVVRAIYSC